MAVDDDLPVPLVDKYGMDIISVLVPANCVHIRIKAFTVDKTIFLQCISFPFSKRMNDLSFLVILFFDAECDGTLHSV